MILNTLFNAAFDPLYFREIAYNQKPSSFKFFFWMTFLQGLLVSAVAAAIIWTHYDNTLMMIQRVAPEFQVSLDKRHLILKNIEQPIHLELAGITLDIDSNTNGVPKSISSLHNNLGAFFTQNAVFIKYDAAQPSQPIPYSFLPAFRISSQELIAKLTEKKENFILSFFLMSSLLILPSFWFTIFPLIPFVALPLWIILKIFQSPLGFLQVGRIMTFAFALPAFIWSVLLFLDFNLFMESWWVYPVWLLTVLVVASLTLRPYQRQQEETLVLGLEKQVRQSRGEASHISNSDVSK